MDPRAGATRKLFSAAKSGDLAKAKQALADGADVHAENGNGWTPIAEAALWLHAPIVSALLEAGADPNVPHRDLTYTPLFRATFTEGCAETVRALLVGGAAPTLGTKHGWAPLHNAAEHGDLEAVELLLAAGADPASSGGPGSIALVAHAKAEIRDAVSLLVDKYASTKKQSLAEALVAAASTRRAPVTPAFVEPAPLDLSTWKVRGAKPVDGARLSELEKRLGERTPSGYRVVMERFGAGTLDGRVRIYSPDRVEGDLDTWRARVAQYWFWGDDPLFTRDTAQRGACIADTVDGDEIVYALASPDTLVLLPREAERAILLAKSGLLAALSRVLESPSGRPKKSHSYVAD